MEGIHIKAYGDEGFQLDNNIILRGSALIFSDLFLLWKPRNLEMITPETLAPLVYRNPPLDLVIFGTGDTVEQIPVEARHYLLQHHIFFECMDNV